MKHRPAHMLLLAVVAVFVGGHSAAAAKEAGKGDVVFVQTNEVTGNRIVV